MARNEEKAQSMLNRWVKVTRTTRIGACRCSRTLQLKSGAIDDNAKRPHLASMASSVHEAEKWRGQIVKEISRKVLLIQNRSDCRTPCTVLRCLCRPHSPRLIQRQS